MSEYEREWRFYLDDMIAFAERVQAYPQIPWRMIIATRVAPAFTS